MGKFFRILVVSAMFGAPTALVAQDSPSPLSVAERIGCELAGKMAWLKDRVARGTPPLLVVNDEPSGAVRFDPVRCAKIEGEPLEILSVRVLRPAAAQDLFGPDGRHGAVLVEITRRRR